MELRLDQLQQPVKLLDGKDAKTTEATEDGKPPEIIDLTVRLALRRALTYTPPETRLGGDKMFERFSLATKIWNADEKVALSVDECKIIKECVADAWNIEVVGFIYNLIDPHSK